MPQSKPSSVTDSVFDHLHQNVRSGLWKPGDKLPSEAQLCAQLGASRITVRSALGRLAALGLVYSQQGKGTFVCDTPSAESAVPMMVPRDPDRLSVFEFRKIIEGESIALAAIRATSAEVEAMQATIVDMEQAKTAEEIANQDMLFHSLIAKASGNEIIEWTFHMMESVYSRMFAENIGQVGNSGVADHRQMLLDIQVRDMKAARQHMISHLEAVARAVCQP